MRSKFSFPLRCLLTAVFFLLARGSFAQLKLNTANPYDSKKEVSRSGSTTNTIALKNTSTVLNLPIPGDMPGYTQFQNNLAILSAVLQEQARSFGKCKVDNPAADVPVTDAAILHLYLNDGLAASLLAVKAAQAVSDGSTDLPRRINNLGAILIELGQVDVAIPYLKYAAKLDPKNPSILNNLGQACVQKQEITLAIVYLKSVLRIMPKHPLANLTMAYLNQYAATVTAGANSKEYDEAALTNAKNALAGGFLSHAWHLVQKMDQDARLQDHLADKVATVNYISDEEPPIPPNCTSVHQAYALSMQQLRWFKYIDKLRKYYDSVSDARLTLAAPKKAELDKIKQQAGQMMTEERKIQSGGNIDISKIRSMNATAQSVAGKYIPVYDMPFSYYAYQLRNSLLNDRTKDALTRKDIGIPLIGGIMSNFDEQRKEAISKATSAMPAGDDRANATDNISDSYLEMYDMELQKWRMKRWEWDKKYYNWRLFWLFVEEKNEQEFYGQFCYLMSDYYDELKNLTIANWYIFPAYNANADKKLVAPDVPADTLKASEIACPFTDLTVKAGNTHMIMNCRKTMDSKADASDLTGGCIPKEQKGVYSVTFLLGLDASLKNYLLVEDGIVVDNSIKWDRNMQWEGAAGGWWLNSGSSELKTNAKK